VKAIVWTKYGPPEALELHEVAKPVPKDDEVLIKVHVATVTAGDCEVRSLKIPFLIRLPMRIFMGIRKPTRVTVLGQELAGKIEAVGKEVTRFEPGTPVFGATGLRFGAYAEYACLSEMAVLAPLPANMSFEEAATVPTGGLEALHFLTKAKIRPGESVLINGAGGSIGTYGVQFAKHFGAVVTAVDSSGKLAMLQALGADHVIDYTQEDFANNGQTYDVIFDVVGKRSLAGAVRSLKPNGRYLLANPGMLSGLLGRWASRGSGKQVIVEMTAQRTEDLLILKDLIEADVLKSVIDRRYPLAQTAEAHAYVQTGQKAGNVVITVAQNDNG